MLVTRIWKGIPGRYFCISTKSRSGAWEDHFFSRKEFRQVRSFLKDNAEKDLYFCPHGFTQRERKKSYAVMPPLLWADLDAVKIHEIQPQPTYAWRSSSGRYQAIWLLDEPPADINLNKRLSHDQAADKSGWILTKVLRIPGTTNYKYKTQPSVRLLWEDGPEHTVADLDAALPGIDRVEDTPDAAQAFKVFQKYSKKLKAGTRRELFGKDKPKAGKRSQVLWRLTNDMIEVGMTDEEIFVVLWSCRWNKFRNRENGTEWLKKDIKRCRSNKFAPEFVEENEDEETPVLFGQTTLADVEPKEIDWIWYPYLARKELTICEGDPGVGKSYLMQMAGLMIAAGERLPSVKPQTPFQGKVLFCDLENTAETVVLKRARNNGYEDKEILGRYHFEEYPFTMSDDENLEVLYDSMERIKPDVVVFDTVNTYMGNADTHKGSEAQRALVPFLELAKRFNCSVCILRHLTKNSKEKALYRGQGNIAFAGMARLVMTVGRHPEDEGTAVLAMTKYNIVKKPLALTYRITALPDTLQEQDRSKLSFGEFVDLTADEILVVGHVKEDSKNTEVERFLDDVLGDGPMELKAVERAAKARGLGMRTVRRIHKERGGKQETRGFGKLRKAYWALAPSAKKTKKSKSRKASEEG